MNEFRKNYHYALKYSPPPPCSVFKWVGLLTYSVKSEEATSKLRAQEYLDDVCGLDIPISYSDWYNVDVASMLTGTSILGHELDSESGDSLIFLRRSAILCSPESGRISHYPKHLLHCFVDDNRTKPIRQNSPIMRAELFSISPKGEQLCWECTCSTELEIPEIQSKVSRWISWLNE